MRISGILKDSLYLLAFSPSLLLVDACTQRSVKDRAAEYLQDRPKNLYDQVMIREPQAIVRDEYNINYIRQSKLDSVAFRDVFNSTVAAKDSSKVAEFNKIAATYRASSRTECEEILANITTLREFNNIKNKASKAGAILADYSTRYEYLQHKTDSIAYRRFFEKNNLLNKKTLSRFNQVIKKIKP